MGTQRTRNMKIHWILRKVEEMGLDGLGIKEDVLISEFCILFFSTRRTGLEIIKLLVESKRITKREKKLFSLKYFNEEGVLNE